MGTVSVLGKEVWLVCVLVKETLVPIKKVWSLDLTVQEKVWCTWLSQLGKETWHFRPSLVEKEMGSLLASPRKGSVTSVPVTSSEADVAFECETNFRSFFHFLHI